MYFILEHYTQMKPKCFSNRNSLLMPQEFNSHLLLRLDAGFTFKAGIQQLFCITQVKVFTSRSSVESTTMNILKRERVMLSFNFHKYIASGWSLSFYFWFVLSRMWDMEEYAYLKYWSQKNSHSKERVSVILFLHSLHRSDLVQRPTTPQIYIYLLFSKRTFRPAKLNSFSFFLFQQN